MKERVSWTIDEQGCMVEFGDDLADCGELLRLEELTAGLGAGHEDVYDLAERLTSLLGRGQPLVVSPLDAEGDAADASRTGAVLADLIAGYTDCMDEAIRYLVEEEQYSMEHPVVQGLRQHLLAQQERVLLEAAKAHHNNNVNNNNTNTSAAAADARSRVALLVDTFCNIRPPSG